MIDIVKGFPKIGSSPLLQKNYLARQETRQHAIHLPSSSALRYQNHFSKQSPAFSSSPVISTIKCEPIKREPIKYEPISPATEVPYDSEATISDPDMYSDGESHVTFPNSVERIGAEAIFAIFNNAHRIRESSGTRSGPLMESTDTIESNEHNEIGDV